VAAKIQVDDKEAGIGKGASRGTPGMPGLAAAVEKQNRLAAPVSINIGNELYGISNSKTHSHFSSSRN
jgi:hypothetical protein